ncbi:MAG: DUF4440 domain-containing protein [Pyrinomonadaceae bacterium]
MKIAVLLFAVFMTVNIFGQNNKDLQALAETEKSFARFAAEKDTKSAFLEFAAPDGILFQPNPVNAKTYWNSRGESKGLLSWQPSFADISSNGALGWTTGPWEFRPTRDKTTGAVAFGDFVTLWQKQPDGKFRFVLDIGVSHDKAQVEGVQWKSPVETGKELNEKNSSAGDSANAFFEAAKEQMYKAYKTYAASDIRVLREGKMPVLGKDNFLSDLKKNKISVVFAKRSVFFGAADLAYITNSYVLTRADKSTEKGNFMQIWKLRGGKWQIVLDIFNPLPEEKK